MLNKGGGFLSSCIDSRKTRDSRHPSSTAFGTWFAAPMAERIRSLRVDDSSYKPPELRRHRKTSPKTYWNDFHVTLDKDSHAQGSPITDLRGSCCWCTNIRSFIRIGEDTGVKIGATVFGNITICLSNSSLVRWWSHLLEGLLVPWYCSSYVDLYKKPLKTTRLLLQLVSRIQMAHYLPSPCYDPTSDFPSRLQVFGKLPSIPCIFSYLVGLRNAAMMAP